MAMKEVRSFRGIRRAGLRKLQKALYSVLLNDNKNDEDRAITKESGDVDAVENTLALVNSALIQKKFV